MNYVGTLEISLENLESNGFHQLCKNYAVEKFHGKFLQDQVSAGGTEGAQGGIAHARDLRWGEAQVENSRQLLAMFEGEERVNMLGNRSIRGNVPKSVGRYPSVEYGAFDEEGTFQSTAVVVRGWLLPCGCSLFRKPQRYLNTVQYWDA